MIEQTPQTSKRTKASKAKAAEAVVFLEEHPVFLGRYICARCCYKASQWYTRCPGCKKCNTLVTAEALGQEIEFSDQMVRERRFVKGPDGRPVLDDRGQPIEDMSPDGDGDDEDGDGESDDDEPKLYCVADAKIQEFSRMSLGIEGFDHLTSPPDMWKGKKAAGPIVGHVIGLTGKPGSGKSTLALEAAVNVSASGGTAVILDGEERKEATFVNANKVAKAKKLQLGKNGDLSGFMVTDETDVIEDALELALEYEPDLVVINSLQEFRSGELDDRDDRHVFDEGDPKQMKRVIRKIVNFAQGKNALRRPVTTLLVVQVKQDGTIDGVGKKVLHKLDACYEFTRAEGYKVKGSAEYKTIICQAMEGKSRGSDDTVYARFKRMNDGRLKPLGVSQ